MEPARCPTCGRPLPDDVAKLPRPFCGRRCKLADLGNWLEGRYVIVDKSPFDEELDGPLFPDDEDGPDA